MPVFCYLAAVLGLRLYFNDGLEIFDWYFIFIFTLMLYFEGGSSEVETLITQDRILRKGMQRGFLGNRSDPPYLVSLNEVARISLADSGRELLVEIRMADSERVDVLRANQPQVLAAAIAEGAGIGGPPQVGRLEHMFQLCAVIVSVPVYVSLHWTVEVLLELYESDIHFHVALVPFVAAYAFLTLLATSLVGFVAVLFMPRFASAAEAANWFRLKPKKRRFRWTGWKSRPCLWLARLAYGSDLRVSPERLA